MARAIRGATTGSGEAGHAWFVNGQMAMSAGTGADRARISQSRV
jgi:hypothetical protein